MLGPYSDGAWHAVSTNLRVSETLGLMSGTSRACLVLEVRPASPWWAVGSCSEVDCVVSLVSDREAEPLFQHRLGEVVRRSPWIDPALALQLV